MRNNMSYFPIIAIYLLSLDLSIVQSEASLVSQICKQTPHYNLCATCLNSDPKSKTADIPGLALIMVNTLKSKSNLTLNKINELRRKRPGLKQPLTSCASNYEAILAGDIPEAKEALEKGNPKFAQNGANDAAVEANLCEESFHGKSPLTSLNNLVHDVSVVASSIIELLL